MLTKVIAMVTVIDDIYDVYGTLDELELFTHAVQRMEVNAMDELPDYMKVCCLALFNTTTEVAYEVLKEQGINVMPYLTKSYHSGYKLNLEEYMENGWISIGAPLVFACIALDSLTNYYDIIRWSATIIRLRNDLGTSSDEMERGDVPKSIQCYMNEKGVSEEDARKHINLLIKETWKLMNTAQRDDSLFSETFMDTIYQHGDCHGIQNSHIKNRIFQLFFEPITISIP
ncbi:hypothetical protein R3W88_003516 [Solanum pinnatisectum]|uniref:Terpene synthase metal-binding domain-containing protein n=1 Tax=Solanum pinnatisectum TaxID=50273 RepID=A0AAV9MS35_9SOLN|nr:hypothetical protein R3W88_003516 [Solanum pinnatisectum]